VAYSSTAQGLVEDISPSHKAEVYVRDLVAGVTIWASTNAANLASNLLGLVSAASYHPVISDDGRYVSYKTGRLTRPWGPVDPCSFFNTTRSLARPRSCHQRIFPWFQNDDITGPEMSPDGRYLVFAATNQSAGCVEIDLWDATLGTNAAVSVAGDGSLPTNSVSDTPSVSDDGQYVVF